MRRRVPHAPDAGYDIEGAEQVGELRTVLPRTKVASVRVDVLAEQRDLGDAIGGQLLHFVPDVAETTTHLGAAYERHDAERARVVAPDLDRDPGRVMVVAARGQRPRIRLVLLADL